MQDVDGMKTVNPDSNQPAPTWVQIVVIALITLAFLLSATVPERRYEERSVVINTEMVTTIDGLQWHVFWMDGKDDIEIVPARSH